ncbi:MAG TPA: hypothetical protein ENN46_01525, partial [Candidatus Woesearchaeota archaeon]|nr:hypothetical protein [Candidatus Woesearchaeota archaeon]
MLLLAAFSYASVPPVEITEVQVNGIGLSEDHTTRLSIERGEYLNLWIRLEALEDAKDIQMRVFIDGYEHSRLDDIADQTGVFDVEESVEYIKRLKVKLPSNMDRDNYKIKLFVSTRDGYVREYYYNILVDVPRHSMIVRDIALNPEYRIRAGSYLSAIVRLQNTGARDQRGVKVTLQIPELGVAASDFVNKVEGGDSISTEEIAVRIPECVESKEYEMTIKVEFNDGYDSITSTHKIFVVESDLCEVPEEPVEKVIISMPSVKETAKVGERVTFTAAMVNTGKATKTFILRAQGAEWADVQMSENLVVLKEGESKVVFIYATPKEGTAGTNVMVFSIESEGEIVKEVPLTVKVEEAPVQPDKTVDNLRAALEIGIIVLVVILVIIVLILAFSKVKKK